MDTQSELNYLANMKPPDTFGHPKYQPYDLMNHHALEISTQMMPTQPLVTHVEHIPPPPAALAGNGCMPFVPVLPTLGVSPLIQTQPPQSPPAPPAPQAAIETISSNPLAIAVPPNNSNNNNNNSNSNSSDFCNNHTSDKSAVIVNNNNNNSMESSSNAEAPKRKLSTEAPLDGSQYPPQKKDKLQQPLPPIDEKKKRKNIRDVMDTNQLDTITLKAQHEESERLARMAEQQKLLREYQQREAVLTHFDRFVNEHRVKNPEDLLELNGSPKNQALPDSGNGKSMQTVTETESTETEDGEIKEKTPAEVVTIEDSSSDDDCIVLSDDEEDVEEDMDDPENSGLHVKDEFNIPDHLGRVVINVGHPDSEEDIYIAPQIARTIKPHQIGGIRFLFDNIIESTTRFKTSGGFGCILAHSMGLGKTLQVVCFCDIFLRYTPSRTVVCVMPINTLQNWQAEFDMWIPKVSDNYEYIRPRQFDVFVLNDQHKTFTARARVIQQWKDQGGVLLIGYELFRLMALKLSTTGRKRSKRSQLRNDEMDESHHRLMDEIYEALVKPGPDLVICDEGHRIKNSQAGISQALKQIRTRRRIVLTGYPLQNNLVEYWCMVDFVRPNYLGTKTEFCNMFERPIQNGLCLDSTPDDIKLMRYRAHVLHSLLLGFVQRRSHTVLQQSLPEKQEFVILARMTELQRQLYDTFMNDIVRTKNVPNPLKAFAVCCKIWNHPDVLYDAMKVAEYGLDVDIEEVEEIAPTTPSLNKDGFPMPPQPAPPPPSPLLTASANAAALVNAALNGNMQMTQTTPGCLQQQLNSTALDLNSNASTLAGQQQIDRTDFVQQNNNNNNHNNYNMNFSNLSGGGGHAQNSSALTSIMNPTNTNDPMNYQNNTSTPLYGDLNHYGGDSNSALNSTLNNSYQSSDLQSPYFAYSSMLSSMGSPLKPNYVGCMVKQATTADTNNVHLDDTHNSSSEIVDLDTKEIKTIETDIDMDKNIHLNKSKEDAEKCITAAGTATTPATLTKTMTVGGIESENKSELDISSLSGLNAALESNDQEQRRGCDKITYDWAAKYMKKYESGLISNSPKMTIFFCILNESVRIGDRVLLFSQSLLTLNAIEKFLMANQMPGENTSWTYGRHYFRLDGSTTSQERERLVNEFNTNVNVKLFLISTKAGSLGINLVGANRVIIFDASWNPCHDTQAIYRIYRYGQKRACFVYRIVMDKCLEKKIYDRQIKKQGMSDRVVDECNPDNHLSIKDVTNLCYDYDDDDDKHTAIEFKKPLDSYTDTIMRKILIEYKVHLTKEPFFHESLLVDRKNDKLSQAEKRMAHRSYEMQKKTSSKNTFISTGSRVQFQTVRKDGALITKPIASVRPMQAPRSQTQKYSSGLRTTRWIPAEVWQKQGMTAQEMSLPLDVVIPTNSSNKSKIIIKAGQRVMVLKSAKGIYMQLDSGKIIAIRTMNKPNAINKGDKPDVIDITGESETANDAKTDKAETDTTNSSFTDSSMDVDSSTSTSSSLQKAIKTELDKSSEETHKTQQQQAAENLTQTQSQFHQLALFNNTTTATTTNTKVASNNNNHKTAAAAVNTYHHNNHNNSNSSNTNTVNPLKNEDKLNLRGGGGIQAQQQHTTINEQRQQMRMAVSSNPQSLLIQQRKQQQQQQNQQTQPRTGLTQSANENLHQLNNHHNNNNQHNNSNNSTQQQQQSHATTTTATTQAHNLQQQSTANSYTAANHHAANAAAAAVAAAHQHHSHHHGQTYYAPTHAYAAAAASQGHHSQSSNLRNTHHYGAHARSASDISPYGAYATAQYTDFPAYASHDTLAQQNARYHGGSGTHGNLSQAHATTLSDFYASYYPQWSPFMLPPPPPTSAAAAASAANTNDTNHLMHHSYPSAHAHSAHPLPKVQSANNTGPSQWQQYQ